jgi:hypothetical protein
VLVVVVLAGLGLAFVFSVTCLVASTLGLVALFVKVLVLGASFVLGFTSWWMLIVVLVTGFKLDKSKFEPFFNAAFFRAAAWK